jgi:DNA replication protein DnaC
MINQAIQKLQELKLNGFIQALREQQESTKYQDLSFEERFGFLVDKEYNRRQNVRLQRRLYEAKLKQASTVENIDFLTHRKLDKKIFLELAGCTWINNKHNLFITGPTGIGKSFLACALADKACRLGLKAHYIKAAELVTQLLIAKADGSYPRLAQKLAKTNLLIIDEWLLDPLPQSHAREILDLLDDRFRKASTIFVSQFSVSDWHKNIQDPTLADAILDRIIHDAFRLELSGESMRKLTANINN